MTHVRRNAILGSGFVVTLAALFSAGSVALDRPTVDTKSAECGINLNQELIQQLPTPGRTFEAIAGTVPQQTRLEFQVDSKNRPTSATFFSGSYNWRFDKVRFSARDCSVKGEVSRAEFGNGYTGRLDLSYLTRPNERTYLRASNLRLNGGPIKGEQLWYFLPAETQVANPIPPPENLPVLTAIPVTPTYNFSGYLAPGDVWVPDGTTFDLRMNVRPHENHQAHLFVVGTYEDYLCRKAEGVSQISVYDTMRDSFNFRRTLPPRANLLWQDGRCTANADRSVNCNLQGTFHDIPVRSWWTARPVQGTQNIQGEGSLEMRGDTLRYDLTGSWRLRF